MRTIVLAVAVLILACMATEMIFQFRAQPTHDYSAAIKILEKRNEFLAGQSARLDKQIQEVQDQVDSLMQKTQIEKQTVLKLQTTSYEKMQTINHYTHHELSDFFANLKADSTDHP